MIRLICIIAALLALSSCGSLPVRLLTGGGPNVAANVQAGKTNAQTVGTTQVTEQKLVRPQARQIRQSSDTNKVQADTARDVTVNENSPWLIIAFAVALFLDSPIRWPGQIWRAIRKPKGQEYGIHSF